MDRKLINSASIEKSSLHVELPLLFHVYVWPIVPVYLTWMYCWIWEFDRYYGSEEFGRLWLVFCFAIHALSYLICQWSVSLKAFLTCRKVSDPYSAQMIAVMPAKHNGSGAICKLYKSKYPDEVDGKKSKFIWNAEKKRFDPLNFPGTDAGNFASLKKSVGLKTGAKLDFYREKYGLNKFDIPIPEFKELLKEHMVAPFFVFQLFCVALWFLDEMWYYSLFTLVMLFVFESTVVMQRLKNLQEFRTMSAKPFPIKVLRDDKWTEISSDQLLPGDICSIKRQEEDNAIPCDLLILEGSCIVNEAMLSGESTPQLKEPVELREDDEIFDIETDKLHVLFGGTKVLQVHSKQDSSKPATPDQGCLALVLKTGFATQQGDLVRMMLFSTERITANNIESLFFILFLLVFAIVAAGYVWVEGNKNQDRKKSKILLDCILILTSVVPPELPMELSLAVNNSLIALAKKHIFCTEPFRIPFAGKVDIACFDKTGTLTAEDLFVDGVSGIKSKELFKVTAIPPETVLVMAAAHSLVLLQDGAVGDSMEKNTLDSIKWKLLPNDTVTSADGTFSIQIVRRFPFSSALKRMSTVSKIPKTDKHLAAVKGAPETLKPMFTSVPSDYDQVYKFWAKQGSRVLALGYKYITLSQSPAQAKKIHRDSVESDLQFAGFLVFTCPLKTDAQESIKSLNDSAHRVVMITGDNPLTACHVAKQVEICKRTVLIGDLWDGDVLSWRSVDESINLVVDLDSKAIPACFNGMDLCVTGKALQLLQEQPLFKILVPKIWVYARVSPNQKEMILQSMKQLGYTTLMCGDGTNDVGALKQAHIGIALLNGNESDIQKLQLKAQVERQQQMYNHQCQMRVRLGMPVLPPPRGLAAYTPQPEQERANLSIQQQKELQQQQLKEQMSQLMGDSMDDVPQLKFGDASVAAPFTSKISSVNSVCNIVRQGRSTLVAMTQMYKILALNCIISAYSMSVMYLAGIKQGDWQATVAGILLTICFFGIAKSNSLEKLSKKRPQENIFNLYLILSVLGQAAIHIGSLMYIRGEAILVSEDLEEEIDLDATFKPNILNSAVYLVSLIMHVATFAINYQGEPFRESLTANKPLYNSLRMVAGIAFLAALEWFSPLTDYMQLVPFPDQVCLFDYFTQQKFRYKLLAAMVLDFGLAYTWERMCDLLFSGNKPRRELFSV